MNWNRPRAVNYLEYNGFLHIRCDQCGTTKTFCKTEPITHHICRECGNLMELGREQMSPARMYCECGRKSSYQTNVTDRLVEIDCVVCGSPCVSEWHYQKKRYVPIRGKRR